MAQRWTDWYDQKEPLDDNQDDSFKVIIFSNNSSSKTKIQNLKSLQGIIKNMEQGLSLQLEVFLAIKDTNYWNPNNNNWNIMKQYKNDLENKISFGGSALNASASPFSFTASQKITPKFDPNTISEVGEIIQGYGQDISKIVQYIQKQMIIFVGAPGSGKTTFWNNYLSKYERIDKDTLKTKEKCYKIAEQKINQGKSVVIDNFNTKNQDRAFFMELAFKHNLKVRCFHFMTSKDICMHNDWQKAYNFSRKHFSTKAGAIPITIYFKYLEEPKIQEGFYEIHKVNFVPQFYDQDDREAYYKTVKN